METEVIQAQGAVQHKKQVVGTPSAGRIRADSRQRIVSGWQQEAVQLLIRITIFRIIYKSHKNISKCLDIMKQLDMKRRAVLGENKLRKYATVDRKLYWDLYTPGWPSLAFNNYIRGEVARIAPVAGTANRFTNIFLAITKKCPLRCEHCFEWDALNGKEKLTLADIRHMVKTFGDKGTGQIQFTGGEPLLRVDDIATVVGESNGATQFWVLTSGFQLTVANAQKLKAAGTTGIAISLDHFDPEMHNAFRGFKNAYSWVEEGAKNAIDAGLVVALSICVTKAFVTEGNLMAYATLAKEIGVSFIQILEPKAVGHYKGADVVLKKEHEAILERFYFLMNYDKRYLDFPVITYHGFHQRHTGCFGAGNRNLYIDTDGDIHACPFCQHKRGSALGNDLDAAILGMNTVGCHDFRAATI